MKKKHSICLDVLWVLVLDGVDAVKGSLGLLSILIQVLLPCVLALFQKDYLYMLVLSSCVVFLSVYLRKLHQSLMHKDEDGVPIPTRKFTDVGADGMVRIREGAAEAALVYLSDLEEYFKKRKKVVDKM